MTTLKTIAATALIAVGGTVAAFTGLHLGQSPADAATQAQPTKAETTYSVTMTAKDIAKLAALMNGQQTKAAAQSQGPRQEPDPREAAGAPASSRRRTGPALTAGPTATPMAAPATRTRAPRTTTGTVTVAAAARRITAAAPTTAPAAATDGEASDVRAPADGRRPWRLQPCGI